MVMCALRPVLPLGVTSLRKLPVCLHFSQLSFDNYPYCHLLRSAGGVKRRINLASRCLQAAAFSSEEGNRCVLTVRSASQTLYQENARMISRRGQMFEGMSKYILAPALESLDVMASNDLESQHDKFLRCQSLPLVVQTFSDKKRKEKYL